MAEQVPVTATVLCMRGVVDFICRYPREFYLRVFLPCRRLWMFRQPYIYICLGVKSSLFLFSDVVLVGSLLASTYTLKELRMLLYF